MRGHRKKKRNTAQCNKCFSTFEVGKKTEVRDEASVGDTAPGPSPPHLRECNQQAKCSSRSPLLERLANDQQSPPRPLPQLHVGAPGSSPESTLIPWPLSGSLHCGTSFTFPSHTFVSGRIWTVKCQTAAAHFGGINRQEVLYLNYISSFRVGSISGQKKT